MAGYKETPRQKMIAMIENTDDLPVHVRLPNKFHPRDSVAAVR